MLLRTPAELGAVLRDRRRKLGLDQSALAKRIGVSRQWVIEVERGHARAELGLILRALDALDIRLDADTGQSTARRSAKDAIDVDAIVARARGQKV